MPDVEYGAFQPIFLYALTLANFPYLDHALSFAYHLIREILGKLSTGYFHIAPARIYDKHCLIKIINTYARTKTPCPINTLDQHWILFIGLLYECFFQIKIYCLITVLFQLHIKKQTITIIIKSLKICIPLAIFFITCWNISCWGGDLYAATVADFSGSDSLIIKNQLRTEQYDYKHLNGKDKLVRQCRYHIASSCILRYFGLIRNRFKKK